MQPRPIDPQRDLPALADLLGRTRSSDGIFHPGGIQWWLRDLWLDRQGFEALVMDAASPGELDGFVLIDDTFVVSEHLAAGDARLGLTSWAADHLRSTGQPEIQTQAIEGSDYERALLNDGFERTGGGLELMIGTDEEPVRAPLAGGFKFGSLADVTDEAYILGHRAAWSDRRPSPYRRELHDAVKRMPQFRPELVTVAIAADGTVASYCIGWMDEQSGVLEIEPLGTHRDYRRLGLARAVVVEVIRRAARAGARDVLVWNEPANNAPAYGLYTSAGMKPRRILSELTKKL